MPGPLSNLGHENFANALHDKLLKKMRRSKALVEAYREHMLDVEGDRTDKQIAPNSRRLANSPEVKERLAELADYSSKIAGIDSAWGLREAKRQYEANLDDYLSLPDENGNRHFRLDVDREKLSLLSELAITDKGLRLKITDKMTALTFIGRVLNWFAPDTVMPSAFPNAPIEIRLIKAQSEAA